MLLKTDIPESVADLAVHTPTSSSASSVDGAPSASSSAAPSATPSTEPPSTPEPDAEQAERLEFTNRLVKLRLVESVYCTSKRVYGAVRSCRLFALSLLPAETMLAVTSCTVASVARLLPVPRRGVLDSALCKGLDVVEFVVPCVDEKPKEILLRLSPVLQICMAVKHLQKTSWDTAGNCFQGCHSESAIATLNEAARLAESLLDSVLPPDGSPPAFNEYADKFWALLAVVAGLPQAYISAILNFISCAKPAGENKEISPAASVVKT